MLETDVCLVESAPDKAPERRREVRYPCCEPAEIQAVPSDGRRFAGTLLDISRSGLRVELGRHFAVDSAIQVSLPKHALIFGSVRHCRRVDDRFVVGIRIIDVYYPGALDGGHIHADQLDRYLAGRGLGIAEVLTVREHLRHCRRCRAHLIHPSETL